MKPKILVLGVSGMLGYSVFINLYNNCNFEVFGAARSLEKVKKFFPNDKFLHKFNAGNDEETQKLLNEIKPKYIINCAGAIKQRSKEISIYNQINVNALLPHKLSYLCSSIGSKIIHFSTDCVFNGKKGMYLDQDFHDSDDIYGRSKSLGEISYKPHLTLRTSIIGHELVTKHGLVEWFLSQNESVNGFKKAIFSGIPTSYIAKIIAEKIVPAFSNGLYGTYNLSSEPIDKYTLLKLIASKYGKDLTIKQDNNFFINRSLDSSILRKKLDLSIPKWDFLIDHMYEDYKKWYQEN